MDSDPSENDGNNCESLMIFQWSRELAQNNKQNRVLQLSGLPKNHWIFLNG